MFKECVRNFASDLNAGLDAARANAHERYAVKAREHEALSREAMNSAIEETLTDAPNDMFVKRFTRVSTKENKIARKYAQKAGISWNEVVCNSCSK